MSVTAANRARPMSVRSTPSVPIRRAVPRNVSEIHSLIEREAALGRMLPRSRDELHERIRTFRIAVGPRGKVLAAGGLKRYDARAAEIIGLAVDPTRRGTGLGGRLVSMLIQDARRAGVTRLFALTLEPEFFARQGFRRGSIEQVPEKVASDCVTCVLRDVCAEVTMILDLVGSTGATLT